MPTEELKLAHELGRVGFGVERSIIHLPTGSRSVHCSSRGLSATSTEEEEEEEEVEREATWA